MRNKRSDIHSPKSIQPRDYGFITVVYDGSDAELTLEVGDNKRMLWNLMETNGWKHGKNYSAGSCYCCGARANYRGAFLHTPTDEVVYFGEACMAKVETGRKSVFDAMRKRVKNAREYRRGKAKAAATLQDLSISIDMKEVDRVRSIPSGRYSEEDQVTFYYSREEMAELIAPGVPTHLAFRHKDTARTITDMMNNLVKYGSWSEKQIKYFRFLVESFTNFDSDSLAKGEAARKEDLAKVTVEDGRQVVDGKIKSIKEPDSYDRFPSRKMLVVREDGWKFWGTFPSALSGAEVGDAVSFSATITVKETGFGFFSRPTKATMV